MPAKKTTSRIRKPARHSANDTPPPPPPIPRLDTQPNIEVAANTIPCATAWLWTGRLPSASLILLEGRKGSGKSTLAGAIAAAVSGGPVPPDWVPAPPRPVIWCGAEESWPAVIRPRLETCGADLGLCCRPRLLDDRGKPKRLLLPSMLDELRALLLSTRAGLLVLDPFSSLADPLLDLRQEQPARAYLEPLADLLWETDTTAILTRHVRKGGHGDALDQGLGSVAVGNTARSILRAEKHPVLDDRQILSVVVCNAALRPPSMMYRLERSGLACRIVWIGQSAVDADVLAEGRASAADRGEQRDAVAVLRGILSRGAVLATAVRREAAEAGVSERSIRRAKEECGVVSERRSVGRDGDGCWYWSAPVAGWPADE